jgi:hypothetical protein
LAADRLRRDERLLGGWSWCAEGNLDAACSRRDACDLAEGLPEPLDLLFDGNNFFITLAHPGQIIRVPATGGTAVTAYVELGLSYLALNDACLFWSSATAITSISRDAADVAVLSN